MTKRPKSSGPDGRKHLLVPSVPIIFSFAFFVMLCGVVVTLADAQAKGNIAQSREMKVETRVIKTFDRAGLGIKTAGQLEFLGGLVLTSPESAFGGWSDITVEPGGRRFLAVSDDGLWLRAQFEYKGRKLKGINAVRVGRLRALSGRFLKGKREKDAEGLSLIGGTLLDGELLISFERIHRVGRFRVTPKGVVGPSHYLKLPKTAKRLSSNKGLEGVTVLRAGARAGQVIAVGERGRGDISDRIVFVLGRKPFQFLLKDIGNMDITSVVSLRNGDVLFLERRFRWSEGVSMRLRRIKGSQIKPGAQIEGEVLMKADFSSQIDNMEGLAVHRDQTGNLILTMISDDNFNKTLQRTVVLQFLLREKRQRAKSN